MAEDASQAALRRLIVGQRLTQALHVAASLRIADRLAGGPLAAADLARAAGADAAALARVLGLLASEGVFAATDDGRFALTPLGAALRSDVADSLWSRALTEGEPWNWLAWGNLLGAVLTGTTAFERTHGVPLFEYLERHPEANATFNELMAAQTRAWTPAIVGALDLAGVATVVDVGGGHGALAAAVLGANPGLRAIVFDRPHVAAGAAAVLAAAGVAERCAVEAGDFFQAVPRGDCYLLKHILHDWDDARCLAILRNCRGAAAEGARLIAIEVLLAPGNRPDYGRYLDVNMLVLTGGRERSAEEYGALFRAAGFAPSRVVPTRSEVKLIEAVAV